MSTKGRPRKISSANAMMKSWDQYKEYCDSKTVKATTFSQKDGKYITAEIPSPITYTIKGFCSFINLTEPDFYMVYDKDENFKSVIARMKQDCENDAREKFENRTLDAKLAGLWMSNYGYTTNTNSNVDLTIPVVFSGENDIEE